MIDLYLDPTTHDLVFSNFTFNVTTRKEDEITQRLKVKLLWFKEEWVFNVNYGIPYFQEIFSNKKIDLNDVDDIFRTAISQEPGVVDLISYSSTFDDSTRDFNVKAKVLTDSGEIVNLSFQI